MKKSSLSKLLSLALVLAMTASMFTACSNSSEPAQEEATEQATTQATETSSEATEEAAEPAEEGTSTPLVVGYDPFSGKFSPFWGDTVSDNDVVTMLNVSLVTVDRSGAIVFNALDGETIPYNGTDYTYTGPANVNVNYDKAADETVYTFTIGDDIKYSDGEVMDADDIIFTMYALSDPSYDGSTTIYSIPIKGMQDYRTQTSSEVYDKFKAMYDDIYSKGRDYTATSGDSFSQEQADALWTIIDEAWLKDVQAIVDYCKNEYAAYYPDYVGFSVDDVAANPGLEIAAGMALWGFGETDLDTKVLTTSEGNTYDMSAGEFPTLEDYFAETQAAYATFDEYAGVESIQDVSPVDQARDQFISVEGPKDPSLGGEGVPNIAGIKKISDTVVEVTVDGYDAAAIYRMDLHVAPLHYYGDLAQYDYENNQFGFPYGDLSVVASKTSAPLGAGPYKFVKYENKVVYFEANENYYKGEPKTKYMQFKEGTGDDKISGVATGTIDITDPSFGTAAVEEIKSHNSNGEVTGDVIATSTVDNLGYGYIGINSNMVNVGGEPASDASKNLRKAFATMLAVYRDISIDSYYGERASIINYPISNTSWAAPQKSDEGYEIAFSKDVEGKQIYTSDMNAEAKYVAAMDAAKAYLIEAGYTYDDAAGKFTAAPAGAKLQYEIIVPGDGSGDHPSFMIATMFKDAMDSVGFDIILNDPSDSSILWDKLDSGKQEMWCAAWQATPDPDLYQIYHSSNETNSNHYHIADETLDTMIIDARKSDDQAYRKATYKACLDIIIDWAVEIPIYQRQNCIIFSAERVNLDTVTPDITTYWNWGEDIELVEMK